mmetsp:Transcript_27352/g.31280  ORF Transcript_27352/g.31280 Transcript_27352/m.31280 type:complete len:229 (-) Transcript_27352:1558-2244(-)
MHVRYTSSEKEEKKEVDEQPPSKRSKPNTPAKPVKAAETNDNSDVSDTDVSDVEVSDVSSVDDSSDSSDDSDSESESSDSESSSDEEDAEAIRKRRKDDDKKKRFDASAAAAAWVPTPPKKKSDTVIKVDKGSDGAQAMSAGKPFQRVDDQFWGEVALKDGGAMANNSYEGAFGEQGFGARASSKLLQVRGKRFQHEKTKAKRSYNGFARTGQGIQMDSNSTKFQYDD